ncbi:MAG: O-antigen ligase family protein [Beijerinckiaceae bacterium]
MASQAALPRMQTGEQALVPDIAARRDFLFYACLTLFAATIFLSVALVKFGIPGLPLRAICAALIIVMVAASAPRILWQSIHDVRMVLLIILACAVAGAVASLLNRALLTDLARQILEIHVQAAISVVVGACLVRVCGLRPIFFVLAGVIGLSTALATLQFIGVDAAWVLRSALQRLQPVSVEEDSVFLVKRLRAMGLSFSPVHLGTQLCLLFATGFLLLAARQGKALMERFSPQLIVLLLAVTFGAIVSGNRSPLLGLAVFLVLYVFVLRPAIGILLALTVLPFVVFLDDLMNMLATMGVRVAKTDDGSSAGRKVLRTLGILLFLDRPYGYGLSFDSRNYWSLFWEQLKNFPNQDAVMLHALHNYYLMVINKHGVAIILIAAFAVWRIGPSLLMLLAFLPYAIHINYHNDGPFQADFIFWFILPMARAVLVGERWQRFQKDTQARRQKSRPARPLAAS